MVVARLRVDGEVLARLAGFDEKIAVLEAKRLDAPHLIEAFVTVDGGGEIVDAYLVAVGQKLIVTHGTAEHGDVGAETTVHYIVPGTAGQRVVADAAGEEIVVTAAGQRVVVDGTSQDVGVWRPLGVFDRSELAQQRGDDLPLVDLPLLQVGVDADEDAGTDVLGVVEGREIEGVVTVAAVQGRKGIRYLESICKCRADDGFDGDQRVGSAQAVGDRVGRAIEDDARRVAGIGRGVEAVRSLEDVVTTAAGEDIGAAASVDQVIAAAADEGVVSGRVVGIQVPTLAGNDDTRLHDLVHLAERTVIEQPEKDAVVAIGAPARPHGDEAVVLVRRRREVLGTVGGHAPDIEGIGTDLAAIPLQEQSIRRDPLGSEFLGANGAERSPGEEEMPADGGKDGIHLEPLDLPQGRQDDVGDDLPVLHDPEHVAGGIEPRANDVEIGASGDFAGPRDEGAAVGKHAQGRRGVSRESRSGHHSRCRVALGRKGIVGRDGDVDAVDPGGRKPAVIGRGQRRQIVKPKPRGKLELRLQRRAAGIETLRKDPPAAGGIAAPCGNEPSQARKIGDDRALAVGVVGGIEADVARSDRVQIGIEQPGERGVDACARVVSRPRDDGAEAVDVGQRHGPRVRAGAGIDPEGIAERCAVEVILTAKNAFGYPVVLGPNDEAASVRQSGDRRGADRPGRRRRHLGFGRQQLDCRVVEDDLFDPTQGVGALVAVGGIAVGDNGRAGRSGGEGVVSGASAEDGHVDAAPADQRVVALAGEDGVDSAAGVDGLGTAGRQESVVVATSNQRFDADDEIGRDQAVEDLPRLHVGDDVLNGIGEVRRIEAVATGEQVAARAAEQIIVAVASFETVGARATFERVVSPFPEQTFIAVAASQDIGVRRSDDAHQADLAAFGVEKLSGHVLAHRGAPSTLVEHPRDEKPVVRHRREEGRGLVAALQGVRQDVAADLVAIGVEHLEVGVQVGSTVAVITPRNDESAVGEPRYVGLIGDEVAEIIVDQEGGADGSPVAGEPLPADSGAVFVELVPNDNEPAVGEPGDRNRFDAHQRRRQRDGRCGTGRIERGVHSTGADGRCPLDPCDDELAGFKRCGDREELVRHFCQDVEALKDAGGADLLDVDVTREEVVVGHVPTEDEVAVCAGDGKQAAFHFEGGRAGGKRRLDIAVGVENDELLEGRYPDALGAIPGDDETVPEGRVAQRSDGQRPDVRPRGRDRVQNRELGRAVERPAVGVEELSENAVLGRDRQIRSPPDHQRGAVLQGGGGLIVLVAEAQAEGVDLESGVVRLLYRYYAGWGRLAVEKGDRFDVDHNVGAVAGT